MWQSCPIDRHHVLCRWDKLALLPFVMPLAQGKAFLSQQSSAPHWHCAVVQRTTANRAFSGKGTETDTELLCCPKREESDNKCCPLCAFHELQCKVCKKTRVKLVPHVP